MPIETLHSLINRQSTTDNFNGEGFETLSRILTSMLLLMTRLRKAEIHTSVSEKRKLYYNYGVIVGYVTSTTKSHR